ncbi:two-component sensor histidine kinase [Clavibacter michiganensis]|uniref:sensor histidine kinase n=1 Tax=Clavibacter michiganensis TaxID=28447 RepID=UPI000CE91954|nr:histidine kinase [Clavibacter michiganensis]PPF57401.1 two-component sensor histidine kinase [Clavibacter michiganensis]
MLRRIPRYQLVLDVALAAAFVALLAPGSVGVTAASALGVFAFATSEVSLVLVLVMGTALALRRVSPGSSLAVAWAGAVIQMGAGSSVEPGDLAIAGVVYCTAAYGGRVVRALGLASAIVGGVVAASYLSYAAGRVPVGSAALGTGEWTAFATLWLFLLLCAWSVLLASWTAGRLVVASRASHASRDAQAAAERDQARALHDVVVEQERNRIARDMHDVVAHSLAVVIAQADGARYARQVDPEAADQALRTISTTARQALGDVRILLAQLRHSEDDTPQPELKELSDLIDQMRSTGLTIGFVETGRPGEFGTGQQLAVYRIVQEALTNVLRHGDVGHPVEVELAWAPDGVSVAVRSRTLPDPVRPARTTTGIIALPVLPPAPVTTAQPVGHGLAGMRERATLSGGRFSAGVREGVWTVSAWIPFAPATRPVPRVPVPGASVGTGAEAPGRPLTLDELFPPEAAAAGTATPGVPVSPHRTAAARGAASAARRARDDRPAGS